MANSKKYKKVVFIDDDKELLDLYKMKLEKKELSEYFIHFDNPKEGIRFLKESKKEDISENYILIDLYMPGLSGFDILNEIAKINKIKNSAEIYVCTASTNEEDRKRAMKYPFVSAFLEKPLANNFLELLITDGLC